MWDLANLQIFQIWVHINLESASPIFQSGPPHKQDSPHNILKFGFLIKKLKMAPHKQDPPQHSEIWLFGEKSFKKIPEMHILQRSDQMVIWYLWDIVFLLILVNISSICHFEIIFGSRIVSFYQIILEKLSLCIMWFKIFWYDKFSLIVSRCFTFYHVHQQYIHFYKWCFFICAENVLDFTLESLRAKLVANGWE